MHGAAPAVMALAVLGVAAKELLVTSRGVEAGTVASAMFITCLIPPLSAYLSDMKKGWLKTGHTRPIPSVHGSR